ncbi:TetR/AcrR family transcriptional regulator [Humibacter ginsenosidimutans]|uniref:TetR/AcrR family transcriptional regulator n=1 Tax=Humibacter ginsenosidimutans TaxID=2599293 RepID=A0A5B8M1D4_9MICO|nr:TetR/AcrR family transcriptional regulator [Humibacter ginsenosidimutans]QDZ13500.1 TetR/AcrR family transcriptional regulator [Humibacter ginsenosidimutans]
MPDQSAIAPRPPAPAKIKILNTADRLFYDEGVHTVGVDRIIAQSHVTKATFYKHYRSKDLLIAAFIDGRTALAQDAVAAERERTSDPAAIVRFIVDGFVAESHRPGYHGCPFINAATSQLDASGPVTPAVAAWRTWLRSTLVELFTAAGTPNPEDAADDLLLARDGAFGGGPVADPVASEASLRRMSERLLG